MASSSWIIFLVLVGVCFALVTAANNCTQTRDCSWNGRCTNGHCACFDGFYNGNCSGDCGCQGQGICKSDHTCQCDEGWKWSSTTHTCVWDCNCVADVNCIGPGVCGCQNKCQWGTCWNGQCECYEGYTGETCSTYNPNIMMNKDVNVGMNLGGITYYSSEVKFVDIAKQSSEWITERLSGVHANEWDSHEQNQVTWRPDGYPQSLPDNMQLVKLMHRDYGYNSHSGNYTVLYDGEGEINFRFSHAHIIQDRKGRIQANFQVDSGGVLLVLRSTNPANPVHNIRVILPGFEHRYEQFPFNPSFEENLKRYSELRFMDFISTNGHTPEPTTWDSRKRTDFHTQSGTDGGSLEHMIHLANLLGANPWFNLPHAADDNYVRQFASLVKSTLRPDLKVYVEYSNEAWNGIFRQTTYCKEQGMKLHLDIHDWKAGMIYYGRRGAEIADIWNGVFGATKDRVIPVFAWQTGYRDYYRQAVEALGQNLHKFKAFAITGYIECQGIAGTHKAQMVQMSMAEIQKFCMDDIPNYQSDFKYYMDLALVYHKAVASLGLVSPSAVTNGVTLMDLLPAQKFKHFLDSQSHGVKLLMYEGGPGIVESGAIEHGVSNNDVTAKAIAFNHDPLMEPVVHDVLAMWDRIVSRNASNGFPGGLFNYFSYTGKPSKYGSWGMLEHTGQDPETVPKFRGTQRYITETFVLNPLGPKCTFVKDASTSYGCFATSSSGQFKCGSTIDGTQWTYFPSLNQSQGDYLVLDGYDKVKGILYIRVTDHYGANTYHTIDAKQHAHWDTISDTWDYYRALASRHSIRSLPPGVYAGLHVPVKCT